MPGEDLIHEVHGLSPQSQMKVKGHDWRKWNSAVFLNATETECQL